MKHQTEEVNLTKEEIQLVRQAVLATYNYIGTDMPQIENEPNWVKMEIIFDADYLRMATKHHNPLPDELYDKVNKFVQQELGRAYPDKAGYMKLSKIFWE